MIHGGSAYARRTRAKVETRPLACEGEDLQAWEAGIFGIHLVRRRLRAGSQDRGRVIYSIVT